MADGTVMPNAPYLGPIENGKQYSLVMDLDETLLHFEEESQQLLVRPGTEIFLEKMAKFYDIVVFTAGMKDYADWAVSHFYDNAAEKYISARFYREFAMPCSGFYVKDLSRLGRDLSKTIIIDNTPECFLLQPQNGIQIKNWYRDPEDTALTELSLLLE